MILKIWAILKFEAKQIPIDLNKIFERLDPLRKSLFNDFNLLSKNEGLLLLHGFTEQQEKLRIYDELLGQFNSYTLFRNGSVDTQNTAEYKIKILEARKDLYQSLNKALSQ